MNDPHRPNGPAPGPDESVKDLPGLAGFVTLGTTIAATVSAGVVGGIFADGAWGISPWGLLVGLLLGTALAVVSVIQLVKRWL